MNRLFLRFFVWFLAANLATVAATFVIAQPVLRALQQDRSALAQNLGQRAVELFEQKGPRALRELLQTSRRDQLLSFALIRPGGRPAIPIPREMHHRLRDRVPDDRGGPIRQGSAHPPPSGRPAEPRDSLVTVEVPGQAGNYRFIALLPPPHTALLSAFGPLRIGVSVLVLAILALAFSQALARPLQGLSAAARRMAAGDLSARAGPVVGLRHDELGELAREFDSMAAQLEKLVGSQQRLLRDMSHELRSPLARLEVALELARGRGGPKAELDRIGLEAARLADLVEQLLTYARLESAPEILFETIDLARLIRDVAEDAQFVSGASGARISVSAPDSLLLDANPTLLRSALDNLLRNAQKYAADSQAVEVSLEREAAQLCLRVRDHGPGVDPDLLSKIFDPFVRTSAARDRSSGGYGIGLAIVAQVVRRHRGSVQARNMADGGLCVEIVLPCKAG